jgi:hypothetical protein
MEITSSGSGRRDSVILVSPSLDGHRREFVSLFERELSASGLKVETTDSWKKAASSQKAAFFLMIEDAPSGFAFSAFTRGLQGRKTLGLLFRAAECATPKSIRTRIKNIVMRVLRVTPNCSVFTIQPVPIVPKLGLVSNGWIYDPQLWDLKENELVASSSPISNSVVAEAAGRKIIIALGAQNHLKGFDKFVAIWNSSATIREQFLFVVAGRISEKDKEIAAQFMAGGGVCADRFISDEELRSLYSVADAIWAAYAPVYDQSSGIFGRAVQFGVPSIIRRDSYSHKLSTHLGVPVIVIDAEDAIQDAELIVNYSYTPNDRVKCDAISGLRRSEINKILGGLGAPYDL